MKWMVKQCEHCTATTSEVWRSISSQQAAQLTPPIDCSAHGPLHILNIASTAGIQAMPEFSAYSASKHAIIGLTRSAALEAAPDGIQINAILPGTTYTSMVQRFEDQWPQWQQRQNQSHPAGRIGRVDDIVDAIIFLIGSRGRGMKWLLGQSLVLDGGASI